MHRGRSPPGRAHDTFDAHGQLRHPEHAEVAAAGMVRQLTWWAGALRRAKREHPYEN
ncbi:hypothetical protein [Micromonospora sp. WMMD812]|uniref:hypothetical protein n=1 Tax=Micromonospora sp. WMMD812 TaxID=3015152 RepID=UPI00248BCB8B|nr:hypothetical protein [Micromonospora sp. WMMD812]WBB68533.1 hypothetical protein O7603_03880 [Micromonospora sp. WMMD812]